MPHRLCFKDAASTSVSIHADVGLLLHRTELILANTAKWAHPIIWDVLESCSWGNAIVWVAYCWVIYPSTYVTYILLHNVFSFLLFCVNTVVT